MRESGNFQLKKSIEQCSIGEQCSIEPNSLISLYNQLHTSKTFQSNSVRLKLPLEEYGDNYYFACEHASVMSLQVAQIA